MERERSEIDRGGYRHMDKMIWIERCRGREGGRERQIDRQTDRDRDSSRDDDLNNGERK